MNSSNLGRMPVWQSIFNLAPAPWWVVASMGWCGAPGGQSLLQVMRHGGYMTEQWMIGDSIDFCRELYEVNCHWLLPVIVVSSIVWGFRFVRILTMKSCIIAALVHTERHTRYIHYLLKKDSWKHVHPGLVDDLMSWLQNDGEDCPQFSIFCRFRWWYSTMIPCCKRISSEALRSNSSARQLQVRTRDEQVK